MNLKICKKCNESKEVTEFYKTVYNLPRAWCKNCELACNAEWRKRNPHLIRKYRENYKLKYPNNSHPKRELLVRTGEHHIIREIKRKAKHLKIPFNLNTSDVTIPEFCPIFGVKLVSGATNNSYSIDKIIPSLGYIKENVIIVSLRVNRIKSDASLKELKKLYEFYKKLIEERNLRPVT